LKDSLAARRGNMLWNHKRVDEVERFFDAPQSVIGLDQFDVSDGTCS